MPIQKQSNPSPDQLQKLGVKDWPIWTKEASEFPWKYDSTETCYLLEGEVEVTPDGEPPVTIKKGDLVTFPQGMSCRWDIKKEVRKHYQFS